MLLYRASLPLPRLPLAYATGVPLWTIWMIDREPPSTGGTDRGGNRLAAEAV
ncbi:hypothetical protein [Actinomadura sp. NPDC049753]|uniref:hypothetical protein n=1 Tax=Actinomadura sp. NPDC049753 TaxID=3154739 RepID=UPI00341B2902